MMSRLLTLNLLATVWSVTSFSPNRVCPPTLLASYQHNTELRPGGIESHIYQLSSVCTPAVPLSFSLSSSDSDSVLETHRPRT
jgi:hypothetical protein